MARKGLTVALADRAFDRVSVPTVPASPPWVASLVDQIATEFMFGPPISLHLHVPDLLAAVWAIIRESHLAGPMDRVAREVIASAVSTVNACPFCIDSHTAATTALGADSTAKAVRGGVVDRILDDDLRAAATWALSIQPSRDRASAATPFAPSDQPYALGTALAFHYINRMVNAFLKPWPIGVPGVVNRRPFMTRVNGVFPGRRLGVGQLAPGASLVYCGASPSIPVFTRLFGASEVARAWEAFGAVTDEAGAEYLSPESRSAVVTAVGSWDGTDPPLGRTWLDPVTVVVAPSERATTAFAVTCALASYRVDQSLTDAVRAEGATDAALVSIAAWSSAQAVRYIAASL